MKQALELLDHLVAFSMIVGIVLWLAILPSIGILWVIGWLA
jgi:hypothetical protein